MWKHINILSLVFQEAMIKAYNALPKFRMDSQFSTWLYRIVVNTALSSRRKLKNRLSKFIYSSEFLEKKDPEVCNEAFSKTNKGPENELLILQLNKAIKKALLSLSDKERIAFVLCHQQEFKIKEAAGVMRCGEGAVKSYLFRAREKLKKELAEFKS